MTRRAGGATARSFVVAPVIAKCRYPLDPLNLGGAGGWLRDEPCRAFARGSVPQRSTFSPHATGTAGEENGREAQQRCAHESRSHETGLLVYPGCSSPTSRPIQGLPDGAFTGVGLGIDDGAHGAGNHALLVCADDVRRTTAVGRDSPRRTGGIAGRIEMHIPCAQPPRHALADCRRVLADSAAEDDRALAVE